MAHARLTAPTLGQGPRATERSEGDKDLALRGPRTYEPFMVVAMRSAGSHAEFEFRTGLKNNPIPEKPLRELVKERLPELGKGQIEYLRTDIKDYYLKRFRRPREAKYGGLNKGFTDVELRKFLFAIDNPKHKLLFQFQAELGLRIGEAVRVNIKDIDFESRELKVFTEKARQPDVTLIPVPLFRETLEFIKANAVEIEACDGYIFFHDRKTTNHGRKEGWLEENYVRKVFREYCDAAQLDDVYDVSEERDERRPHKLHRLTTHSLRHYAITRFARSTNGNVVLTSRFARHRDMATTGRYINTDKKEIYEVIDSLAVSEVAFLKKKLSML